MRVKTQFRRLAGSVTTSLGFAKSIFFPAAGGGNDSDLRFLGSYGYYWSSTPYSYDSNSACYLFFNSGYFFQSGNGRSDGWSVRPVRGFAK